MRCQVCFAGMEKGTAYSCPAGCMTMGGDYGPDPEIARLRAALELALEYAEGEYPADHDAVTHIRVALAKP
jgi:hypothetical protein